MQFVDSECFHVIFYSSGHISHKLESKNMFRTWLGKDPWVMGTYLYDHLDAFLSNFEYNQVNLWIYLSH